METTRGKKDEHDGEDRRRIREHERRRRSPRKDERRSKGSSNEQGRRRGHRKHRNKRDGSGESSDGHRRRHEHRQQRSSSGNDIRSRSSSRRRSSSSLRGHHRRRRNVRGSDGFLLSDEREKRNLSSDKDTRFFLTELAKTLAANRAEGNKFPILGNVIPEFDPMNKSQTIQNWLSKIEECARMYKWDSDQTVHYAMPKLVGVTKTWYQSLPTMAFSWSEWKDKLSESFPSSDDYAELLSEMLTGRARFGESLELHFYEKVNLLNRLEIEGKRAVDCLLDGIDDRSVRLGAKAANCKEPEQILKYFQLIKQRPREAERIRNIQNKRSNPALESSVTNTAGNGPRSTKPVSSTTITCYNCNEQGHYSFKCTKKIMKCTVCNRLGHLATNCPRLPFDDKSGDSKEKTVMLIKLDDVNDNKYVMNLKVNDRPIIGYIDLGSQCTLLRYSKAISIGITWSVDNLPVM